MQTKQYIQVITINKCMIIEAIKGLKKQVAAVTYKQSNPGQMDLSLNFTTTVLLSKLTYHLYNPIKSPLDIYILR